MISLQTSAESVDRGLEVHIDGADPLQCCVTDKDQPSSSWWFELANQATGALVRQGRRIGPAASGLTIAIMPMPDKEGRIVVRHLTEFETNMKATRLLGGNAVTLRVGPVVARCRRHDIELVVRPERVGVDSVWVSEYWDGDALTPLAFLAARTTTIRLATGIV
jgi:Luciferase-like monooxygenase